MAHFSHSLRRDITSPTVIFKILATILAQLLSELVPAHSRLPIPLVIHTRSSFGKLCRFSRNWLFPRQLPCIWQESLRPEQISRLTSQNITLALTLRCVFQKDMQGMPSSDVDIYAATLW